MDQRLGLLLGGACALLVVLAALLTIEYRFFKQQAAAMLALKKEYRNQMGVVRKVLKEYVKIKELVDRYGMMENEEESPERVFVPINRDLEYLKQSTLAYVQDQNISWPFASMAINPDEWFDYTDKMLLRTHAIEKKGSLKSSKVKQVGRTVKKSGSGKRVGKNNRALTENDMRFAWPIRRSDFWLSSPFGSRKKPSGAQEFHRGIDMAAARGTPVNAAAEGTVLFAGTVPGYGKTVVLAHNHKYRTRYAHLDKILVKKGQKVERGECIGKVGSTGSVRSRWGDPSHLHFEVSVFGKRVNPMYFLG